MTTSVMIPSEAFAAAQSPEQFRIDLCRGLPHGAVTGDDPHRTHVVHGRAMGPARAARHHRRRSFRRRRPWSTSRTQGPARGVPPRRERSAHARRRRCVRSSPPGRPRRCPGRGAYQDGVGTDLDAAVPGREHRHTQAGGAGEPITAAMSSASATSTTAYGVRVTARLKPAVA